MNDTADSDKNAHPTPREWAEATLALRQRLMEERPRAFPSGTTRTCPVCRKRTLEGRDDLIRESVVGAIVLVNHNLHGARCTSCGTEFLESYEELALEESGPVRHLTDYKAKVTSVSGRHLGTYWPKDVVRVMGLHNQDGLRVQVLDADTMIITRRHDHE